MRPALLALVTLLALTSFAQEATRPAPDVRQSQAAARSCLAVRPIGSHAFRNIMLIGVAGALISHQQYQVIDAVNYPAKIGQKYHGNDLQTISSSGTRVAILDKHYSTDELHKACE
jgi:hypothetical protein